MAPVSQALRVLARGNVILEHVFELEERAGYGWAPSTQIVIKQGSLQKLGGRDKEKWQGRQVTLSAGRIRWTNGYQDGGLDANQVKSVQPSAPPGLPTGLFAFQMESTAKNDKTYQFAAWSEVERDSWA